MENPFNKISERIEGETNQRLEGLQKKLADLNSGKDWNDWTAEDRMEVKRLEGEIAILQQGLDGGKSIDSNQQEVTEDHSLENSAVKKRLDDLMKKVRG